MTPISPLGVAASRYRVVVVVGASATRKLSPTGYKLTAYCLINAVTGKVGPSTHLSSNSTAQELASHRGIYEDLSESRQQYRRNRCSDFSRLISLSRKIQGFYFNQQIRRELAVIIPGEIFIANSARGSSNAGQLNANRGDKNAAFGKIASSIQKEKKYRR